MRAGAGYRFVDLTTLGWCDLVYKKKPYCLALVLPGTGGSGAARHTQFGIKAIGFVKFDASYQTRRRPSA
jgi:hypothetical protein